jgi:ATP adenylyltransferase
MTAEAGEVLLAPGTLWPAVVERTRSAQASGALVSIPTEWEIMADGAVEFIVRTVASLERKRAYTAEQRKRSVNPFLPYDEVLLVAEVSTTHVCLLNKFNVVDYHLLVVTRAFEHQDERLTEADLLALWACLAEVDGLGFYNGGTIAGASQPHKHLQIAPPPVGPGPARTPMDGLLTGPATAGATSTDRLPFPHVLSTTPPIDRNDLATGASAAYRAYRDGLRILGIDHDRPPPYNLLVTRDWTLMVPRTRETCEGVSVNSLGFAGSLLVFRSEQLEIIRRHRPMGVLAHVASQEPAPPRR